MEDIFALLPSPTDASRPFWEACNEGQLQLQFCGGCRRLFYYPRYNCPHCGGDDLEWRAARGEGTVWSFTHVEVSFYGPQWESQIPYSPVLIDLDEGPRMLSRLVGERRGEVRIGDRVRIAFVPFKNQMLPYFTLIQKSGGMPPDHVAEAGRRRPHSN
jgi:uncharacterized protein